MEAWSESHARLHSLQHCGPLEPPAVMEVFYIRTVQDGSHLPPAAIEHLKCGWCDLGTGVLILLNFH